MDEFDYMTPTGKNNKIFLARDTPFLNSDLLFVEYFDVIKSPLFILFSSAIENDALNMIFDLSEFKDKSVEELYEWYVKRKRVNLFHNLPIKEDAYVDIFQSDDDKLMEWIDEIIEGGLNNIPELCNGYELNFQYTLHHINKDRKILKRVIVYTPFYSETILKDLSTTFGDGVEYVYGDIDSVLQSEKFNITSNSTFVFADAGNVYALENANLLDYSSILIADKYGYNYNNYTDEFPKYDFLKLRKEHIFKLDFFNNIFEG